MVSANEFSCSPFFLHQQSATLYHNPCSSSKYGLPPCCEIETASRSPTLNSSLSSWITCLFLSNRVADLGCLECHLDSPRLRKVGGESALRDSCARGNLGEEAADLWFGWARQARGAVHPEIDSRSVLLHASEDSFMCCCGIILHFFGSMFVRCCITPGSSNYEA